jgi:hypothetical protein
MYCVADIACVPAVRPPAWPQPGSRSEPSNQLPDSNREWEWGVEVGVGVGEAGTVKVSVPVPSV